MSAKLLIARAMENVCSQKWNFQPKNGKMFTKSVYLLLESGKNANNTAKLLIEYAMENACSQKWNFHPKSGKMFTKSEYLLLSNVKNVRHQKFKKSGKYSLKVDFSLPGGCGLRWVQK